MSSQWPEKLAESVTAVLESEVESCTARIEEELTLARSSVEDGRQQLTREQNKFDEYIARVNEKCEKALARIESYQLDSCCKLREWAKESEASLRNNMRTKMRAGIVDGPRLDRALREEEEVFLDVVYESLLEDMLSLDDHLRIEFEDLPEWNMAKPGSTFRTVNKSEKAKLENLAPITVSAAGGLAGLKAGAALGTALGTAVPVIGNVVGGILGAILGGLLGTFLGGAVGKGVKSFSTNERAKAVEPEVFKAIQEFVEETEKTLDNQVKTCSSTLSEGILVWKSKQIIDFEKDRSRKEDSLRADGREREARIKAIQSDLDAIKSYAVMLGEE